MNKFQLQEILSAPFMNLIPGAKRGPVLGKFIQSEEG